MRRIATSWLPVAWVVLTAVSAGQLWAQGRGGPPPDPAAVERGTGLYAANCSFCHGSRAGGSQQAPNLARNQLYNQDHLAETVATIREGRTTKGMPSFAALSEQNITDIVAYLRSRVASARNMLPETALLVGDAKSGQAYFNGEGRCSTCHSATGDLAHVGAKYSPLPLTVAFLTPTTTKATQVKVTLPSGQVVSGTLRYVDGFAVSLSDSSGEYYSWYRDNVKAVDVLDPLGEHRALLAKYTDTDIHNLLAYLVTLK
jgi:cytochrome c oxidase cbb3-type subunit 3